MLSECHVYTTLPASDMARAREFYEKVLGFKPARVASDGVLYDALGSRFLLYPTQFAGKNQATYMAFEVDDLKKMVNELKGRGVRFQEYDLPGLKTNNGIASTSEGHGAWIQDSEGNVLAIFEPVQKLDWPREKVAAGRQA